MCPPHGGCSAQTLAALLRCGFLGLAASRPFPWDAFSDQSPLAPRRMAAGAARRAGVSRCCRATPGPQPRRPRVPRVARPAADRLLPPLRSARRPRAVPGRGGPRRRRSATCASPSLAAIARASATCSATRAQSPPSRSTRATCACAGPPPQPCESSSRARMAQATHVCLEVDGTAHDVVPRADGRGSVDRRKRAGRRRSAHPHRHAAHHCAGDGRATGGPGRGRSHGGR